VQRAAALVTVLLAALTLVAAAPSGSATPTGQHPSATTGPKVVTQPPTTAMLRGAGGRIWWSDGQCRLHVEVLATGHTGLIPGVHCRFWPARDGQVVVATTGQPSSLLINRRLFSLRLGLFACQFGQQPDHTFDRTQERVSDEHHK